MNAATMIYTAATLGALLSVGTLFAYFRSERRWRAREREHAQWLESVRMQSPCPPGTSPTGADEAERTLIPVQRRPFHAALWEDEPDLAPSPRARAIARELAARQRDETRSERPLHASEPLPPPSRGHSATERTPAVAEAPAQEENDEMLKQQMAVAALTVGALTACQSAKRADYQHNPHPRERYEITMTIRDAPGPFTDAVGSMQYLVPDDSCVPETGGPMNPLRINPKEWIRYPIQQVAENIYRAEVWADGMVDEDYYGLGMCKWTLVQTTMSLKGKSVRFTPDLTLRELRAQQPKVLYFADAIYSATDLEGWPESGEESPSRFSQKVRDELFTVTLTPRRIAP